MRRSLIIAVAGVFIGLVFAVVSVAEDEGKAAPQPKLSLPASLDNLFPPKAPAPVFFIKMIEMSISLSGIVSDFMENDTENALNNYRNFKEKYLELAGLVPEWRELYPVAPVDKLGEALKSGDPGQLMAAVDNMGQACNVCHYVNMPLVQQKYHWDDFYDLTATDPLSNQDVSFLQLMHMIDSHLAGVALDVEQGQWENAKNQLRGLDARMRAMKDVCAACHDTERKYYVDEGVFNMIDKIGLALNETPSDTKAVNDLLHGIGQESCTKCHLVHVPAAYARYQMKAK